jgi:hypothetical protein
MFGFIQSGLEPQYPTLQTSNNESYKVFGLIRLRFEPESPKHFFNHTELMKEGQSKE